MNKTNHRNKKNNIFFLKIIYLKRPLCNYKLNKIKELTVKIKNGKLEFFGLWNERIVK